MDRNPASVLVVDDEVMIRQQMSRALGLVGLVCDCAADGEDALRRIAGHHYQLVVTDMRMPERHGHSLAIALLHQLKRPKIVALTGVKEPRLTSELLARGVSEVVYKPVNYFELAERLKKLLEESDAGLEITANAKIPTDMPTIVDSPAHVETREAIEEQLLQLPVGHTWGATALRWIDWHGLPNPPIEIGDFLRRLSRPCPYGVTERRQEERARLHELAVAIELDEAFQPMGDPFKLIVRDLSRHGIGLVHTQALKCSRLAVMWKARNKKRIIAQYEVLRCQQLYDYFDIGCVLTPPEEPACR